MGVVPSMHVMSRCRPSCAFIPWKKQEQGNSNGGGVLFGVLLLSLLAFMSVKHLVVGWPRRVLASASCTALLCLLIMRLFYAFVYAT